MVKLFLMKNIVTLIIFLFTGQILLGQIVINEIDCDTPSIDTMEFVELKSDTPNFALDGYVLVFYNGSSDGLGDKSYLALDLDGYVTDVNGLFVIGSSAVSPVPQSIISDNTIQNGADAVAIYLGSWFDFPEDTVATQINLIDALVYETSDTDATVLMALLGETEIINEGSANNINSIQRNNDGTYTVKTPTPRQLNDGSGIVLNGVSILIAQAQYNEGDMFDITLTTEQNVTEILNLNITLDNETFNGSDFRGTTMLSIPNGQKTISTRITLVDDSDDEGDEILSVNLPTLPAGYLELNDNFKVRVVDNDFTMAAWGVPTDPTFIHVSSTQPNGYYNSLDAKADADLRQALQDIIADPAVVRAQTYADIIDILKEADQNPAHSNQVWLLYTEQGRAKLDFQTSSNSVGKWNREHTYPRSRGGFFSIDLDDIADGPDVFWTTKADSLRHGNSDAHALRATDGPENSSRSNQNYGVSEYDGPSGNDGSFKGDVARSVLYMAVRYNNLAVINGYPNDDPDGFLGDLTTLLDWHRNDLPDDFEMNRNNVIYNWQFNRNPFIDQPDLVEYIWGTQVGNNWIQPLSVDDVGASQIKIYPNPTRNRINILGIDGVSTIEIFSTQGQRLLKKAANENASFNLNLANGVYFVKVTQEDKSTIKKIVIK